MSRSRLWIFFLTTSAILLVVFLYYQQSALFEGFEAQTYDFRFTTLRGSLPASPDIVIVAIDEASIAELGRFPWSRQHFADFVDRTAVYGARAVFMDAFFPEPESVQADGAFAAALERAGNVSLAVAVEFNPDGSVAAVTRSLPELQRFSQTSAHINFTPDQDGVVRWTPLLLHDGEQFIPSFALSAARMLLGGDLPRAGRYEVELGERRIPTDADYFNLIDYTGRPGLFPRYPFVDVLKGRVPDEDLRGKLLLVGSTALGIYDMRVTPFSNNAPGVEVHANIVDSIVQGRFMQRGGFEALLDLVSIVLLGIVTAFITLRLRHTISFPLVLLLILAHGAAAIAAFRSGHWLSMVYPALSIILVYCTTAYLRFFFLDRKARQIRSIFSSYVSKRVVDRLMLDPSQARIGGENRSITVLFADIENYTGFSESLSPEAVVQTLNEYLAEMSKIILAHEGTLDKFMGDGIMAFWGAPTEQPLHAEQAVSCALVMLTKMEELRARWHDTGQKPLRMRIGINSGEAVVGNVGAEGLKMEYTAIGDAVNLTSRLEQINKLYHTNLIVSATTHALLPRGKFAVRELDYVRVVGKSCSLAIFEVLSRPRAWHADYEEALGCFRNRRFEEAAEIFARLHSEYDDHPAQLIHQRCENYRVTPPPDDWDGSHIFLRK